MSIDCVIQWTPGHSKGLQPPPDSPDAPLEAGLSRRERVVLSQLYNVKGAGLQHSMAKIYIASAAPTPPPPAPCPSKLTTRSTPSEIVYSGTKRGHNIGMLRVDHQEAIVIICVLFGAHK
jgi:hypothetical protein